MKRRKIILAAISLLAVIVVISIIHHYRLKTAVSRYRAELKAKGEPVELAQVIPPRVPAERNGAQLLTNAISLLNTNSSVLDTNRPSAMRMVATGKAVIGWKQPYVKEYQSAPTNSWTDIEAALSQEQPAVNLFRRLPRTPLFDFNLNYGDGFGKILLHHLAPGKKVAQRLVASTVVNLRQGNTDTAAKDLQAMLSLVHGFSHDRMLISELVRIAIAQIAMSGTWELLQSTNEVPEATLVTLQSRWSDLEFIQGFENAMGIERAVGEAEVPKMRATNLKVYFDMWNVFGVEANDADGNIFSRLKLKCKVAAWRYWWSYPDELRNLKGMQAVLEAARRAKNSHSFYTAYAALNNDVKALGIASDEEGDWLFDPKSSNLHFLLSSSIQAFEKAYKKVITVEAARQLTITAIALKRFQLKHGRLPDELSELSPEFLPAIPLDPVDGQPLRYRRNGDGSFLLYSIGEDGVDDGGDARPSGYSKSLQWQQGRDWVWPQPATPQEIADFFARPPK